MRNDSHHDEHILVLYGPAASRGHNRDAVQTFWFLEIRWFHLFLEEYQKMETSLIVVISTVLKNKNQYSHLISFKLPCKLLFLPISNLTSVL